MLARVVKEQRGSPLQVALEAYLKDRLEQIHAELVASETDVDMRRAQGKALEIKQLLKAITA